MESESTENYDECFVAIKVPGNDPIFGIGATIEEAVLDAYEWVIDGEESEDEWGNPLYQKLARQVFGDDYRKVLAKHFPERYDVDGELVSLKESKQDYEIVNISRAVYSWVKENGGDVETVEDEKCVLRLLEEVKEA